MQRHRGVPLSHRRATRLAVCLAALVVLLLPSADAQQRPKSPAGKSATQVGGYHSDQYGYIEGQWIEMTYGRPIRRGRNLFGPPDFAQALNDGAPLWRAGANYTTQLMTEAPLSFGDQRIEPGTYTVFIKLTREEWTLVITTWQAQKKYDYSNRDELFGAYYYLPTKDVVRMKMDLEELPYSVDQLNWQFLDMTATTGRLAIFWDRKMASVRFRVHAEQPQ